jgi:hypothetical protein
MGVGPFKSQPSSIFASLQSRFKEYEILTSFCRVQIMEHRLASALSLARMACGESRNQVRNPPRQRKLNDLEIWNVLAADSDRECLALLSALPTATLVSVCEARR